MYQKTHANYLDDLNRLGKSVKPLGKYTKGYVKLPHQCLVCKHIWKVSPYALVQSVNRGCPKCSGNLSMSHQDFVNSIPRGIEVLDTYRRSHDLLRFRCLACNHTWRTKAYSVKQGHGCSRCKGGGRIWTTKEYKKAIQSIHGDSLWLVGTYKGSTTKVKHKCVKGHEWHTAPVNVVTAKCGCPECTHNSLFPNKNKEELRSFIANVNALTGRVYRQYQWYINPKNLKRGKHHYHIDHIYSKYAAFHNPSQLKHSAKLSEICHPCNLRMAHYQDNLQKNKDCHITLSDLRKRIRDWNKKYGRVFSTYKGKIKLLTLDT